jgi:hypothetical protein
MPPTATSLAIGNNKRWDGRLNLHIKSDSSEGVGIVGLRVDNPYDAVGAARGPYTWLQAFFPY